ncbi:MAG: FAD:protein FMN transferase [Tissierellia bacterium]|nr:FAD:protein FMN transferase [Tissierellia bacterium]
MVNLYKRVILIVCMVLFINITTACDINKTKRYEAEFLELFNTATQIVGYSENKREFESYTQLIYDELKAYHELYDIYNDYDGINNIKTINDNAGIKPIKVDKEIIDLIKFSKDAYVLTKGKTNIAMGSVLKIWHDYRTEGIDDPLNASLPPIDLLKEAALHTDINNVIVDEENSTVYLNDPDMSLDVGAIAKGYATERVSEVVKEKGFVSGILRVGGNVLTLDKKIDSNEEWSVGIQNPDKDSEKHTLKTVNLSNKSLVTSGNYERYYTVDGKRYNHIIDPETLFPAEYFAAVTIICDDSGLADALSTALFTMPLEQGKELIESIPNTVAMWIFNDGSIVYSNHFEELIKN